MGLDPQPGPLQATAGAAFVIDFWIDEELRKDPKMQDYEEHGKPHPGLRG